MELYQDIPRIYTAIAEWASCMVYCIIFAKVSHKLQFAVESMIMLAWQCIFLVVTKDLPIQFWLLCMLIAVLNMHIYIYRNCKCGHQRAFYLCLRAFLFAEFAASMEWQLECFMIGQGFTGRWVRIIFFAVVYVGLFILDYHLERRLFAERIDADVTWKELSATGMIVGGVFLLSNIGFVYENTPFGSGLRADLFNTRTLIDLGGLAILYAYQSRANEVSAERELSSINAMLKEQYNNYRNYQDSIDFINVKYHDLKHQIAGLRAEMSDEKRSAWIDQMEAELQTYRPEMQTGNNVLDTIIAGKMMTCQSNGVKLTCVADGKLLGFMHVRDICTIFGNALDNAIESVVMLPDPEKRLVHLTVSEKKNFVLIQVSNYCEQEIRFKDGLPVTTKKDYKNHGFGVKSIRYAVDKYNGTTSCELKNKWFELSIFIPAVAIDEV